MMICDGDDDQAHDNDDITMIYIDIYKRWKLRWKRMMMMMMIIMIIMMIMMMVVVMVMVC